MPLGDSRFPLDDAAMTDTSANQPDGPARIGVRTPAGTYTIEIAPGSAASLQGVLTQLRRAGAAVPRIEPRHLDAAR